MMLRKLGALLREEVMEGAVEGRCGKGDAREDTEGDMEGDMEKALGSLGQAPDRHRAMWPAECATHQRTITAISMMNASHVAFGIAHTHAHISDLRSMHAIFISELRARQFSGVAYATACSGIYLRRTFT